MTAVSAIVLYAVLLFAVSVCVTRVLRRPFVPVQNVKQADGTYDYLPSINWLIFPIGALDIWWLSTYSPPPPFGEFVASAITDTGWIMLGWLLIVRKKDFGAVGFEGRREVLWGGIGFLVCGAILSNLGAIAAIVGWSH
jgi:hypothetical protein